MLANRYGRYVLVFFFGFDKSELSPLNDFMHGSYVCSKKKFRNPALVSKEKRSHYYEKRDDVTTYYENPSSTKLLIIIFINNILLI